MTGRLRQGDRVTTKDGPGVVVACYIATDTRVGSTGWHVVLLDDTQTRKPYRSDKVQLEPTADDTQQENP